MEDEEELPPEMEDFMVELPEWADMQVLPCLDELPEWMES